MSVSIKAGGREYVTWPITGLAGTEALEVSVDKSTWVAMSWTDSTHARALTASPTATSNPADTLVLAAGSNAATIRLVDTPEIVLRDGDIIYAET